MKKTNKKFGIVLGIAVAALILMIMIVVIINSNNSSNNQYTPPVDNVNDTFGNDEDVTAIAKDEITTEKVTAENPEIEVVILSKKFGGGSHGYIEIKEATAYVDNLGDANISVTGIKGGHGDKKSDGTYWYSNPSIPYRVYDANGTELWANNVYVDNYENKEVGDLCKGSTPTYVDANKVARIEIG